MEKIIITFAILIIILALSLYAMHYLIKKGIRDADKNNKKR